MHYDRLSVSTILLGTLIAITMSFPLSSSQPQAEMDERGTRPLRSLMTELGQDMSRISDGIWREDFEMIAAAAERIAHHPRVPVHEREVIQETLVERFPAFVAFDHSVHDTAARLAEAAQQGNMSAVLERADRLTHGCVACHTAFREPVRRALWSDALSRSAASGDD
jgi:cytochrome c556